MADSTTENYDFVKPEVGASGNTWGGKLNANLDAIDALLKDMDASSAAAKATPVLADRVGILDSADEFALKYSTLTQLKAALLAAVSLSDAIFTVVDNADATKKLAFDVSGVATGTTRTLSVPNLSGVIALLTGAQTFTDKTLTQPTITLKQGASALPTVEGDIQWDSDDDYIVVGTGAATKVFLAAPAGLTAGDLLYAGANGKSLTRLAKPTDPGEQLTISDDGTSYSWRKDTVVRAEQATTSGTTKDFTGIPSWVEEISITFEAVNSSGNPSLLVQIGDGGGIETAGYFSSSGENDGSFGDVTNGFVMIVSGAAYGSMVLRRVGGNKWVSSHSISTSARSSQGGGVKELSAALDRVRITTSTGAVFNAGSVGLQYR